MAYFSPCDCSGLIHPFLERFVARCVVVSLRFVISKDLCLIRSPDPLDWPDTSLWDLLEGKWLNEEATNHRRRHR